MINLKLFPFLKLCLSPSNLQNVSFPPFCPFMPCTYHGPTTSQSFNNSNINYSQYVSISPNRTMSLPSDVTPFNLWFIAGSISKCSGCNNKFVKPVIPPFDLCVQHKEWSPFIPCIQHNWPSFKSSHLVVPVQIAQKLTDLHKNFLSSFYIWIWISIWKKLKLIYMNIYSVQLFHSTIPFQQLSTAYLHYSIQISQWTWMNTLVNSV
jgi:hypothetical protein